MITIRPETAVDIPHIHHLLTQAFGRDAEADLVHRLRRENAYTISLAAVHQDEVVGHVFFTPVTIESAEINFEAVALGPVAVLPTYQRQQIGSQLIQAGLDACQQRGDLIVAVLGHANYYPRFGFVPSVQYGIRSTYDVPDEVFMILELQKGVLAGRTGVVRYHPEFDKT